MGSNKNEVKTNVQYRKSVIGRYEGRYFNEAMERMRKEYNKENTKVVFIATSDNNLWLQKHLLSKDDIYFPHQHIRQAKVAQPSLKEISMMHAHNELAVKGKIILKQALTLESSRTEFLSFLILT